VNSRKNIVFFGAVVVLKFSIFNLPESTVYKLLPTILGLSANCYILTVLNTSLK